MNKLSITKVCIWILSILLFSGSSIFLKADSSKPDFNGKISMFFPVLQVFSGEVYSLGGSLVNLFTHNVKVDKSTGEMQITTIGSEFEYQGRLNPYLQVEESDFLFKTPNMIKFLGHDRRVTFFDYQKNVMIVKYFLDNREQRKKEFTLDCRNIDSDTLPTFLQGMLLNNAGDLNLNLIQKAKGLRINADFKLIAADNPLNISSEYHFPIGFQNLLQEVHDVNIYVMDLTGLPGLIHPYKYYFVYRKDPPFQLVAYWGGEPKEAEYAFLKE